MALSMSQVPALFGLGAGTFSREANGPCYAAFDLYDRVEDAYLATPNGSAAEVAAKKELDSAGEVLRNCRAGKPHQDWLKSKERRPAPPPVGPSTPLPPPVGPYVPSPGQWPSYVPGYPPIAVDSMPEWVPYVLGGLAVVGFWVFLGRDFVRGSRRRDLAEAQGGLKA